MLGARRSYIHSIGRILHLDAATFQTHAARAVSSGHKLIRFQSKTSCKTCNRGPRSRIDHPATPRDRTMAAVIDLTGDDAQPAAPPPAALARSGGGVAGNPLTLDSDSDGEAPATDETQQPPPAAADDDDDAPIAPRTLLRNVLGLADPLQNAILHFAGTRELFHLARTYVQFRAVSLRVVKWRLPGDWTLQRMPAPDYRIYYKRVVRVRNLVELVRHRTPCARDTELHSSMSAQEQLAGASAMGRAWPRDEAAYHASRWRDVPPQPAAGAQSGRTAAASAL